MAVITNTTLKDYLKIEGSGQDTFLTQCCTWAQALIESYCRRKFEETIYTDEEYRGDGSSILYTRQYPIISVTAIMIDDTAMTDVESDYVKINKNTGAIYLVSSIFTKKKYPNVIITYKAGFVAANMPEEIKYAVCELAALIYKDSDKGKGRLGIDSDNISEAGGNRFLHKMNEMTLKALSKYRKISV